MDITYIGLGAIGEGIATNIARSGLDFTVFDLNREAMQRVVAQGAVAADSVPEAISGADLVGLVVRNDAQIIDIMTGDDGVLAARRSLRRRW